jgi:flagellar secretion chaperone FliS
MVYGNALRSYKKTKIETADTIKLLLMCYDAIVRDLEIAKAFHIERNMDRVYEKVHHAQDIITELLLSLDYEKGGEISTNLSQLYNYMIRQLIGINSQRDINVYDSIMHMLRELREAWEEVRKAECRTVCSASGNEMRSWEMRA